ncbi:MAG: DUF6488 family protein [Gallionella sp.]
MRNISITLFVSTLLFASPVMAGAGHEHGADGSHSQGPISSDAVTKKAERHVSLLIGRDKIDKSWAGAKVTSVIKKPFEHGDEWVVTFKNDKVEDAEKRTLSIFHTLEGSYTGSNFTGN